jgi:hypothetical protein
MAPALLVEGLRKRYRDDAPFAAVLNVFADALHAADKVKKIGFGRGAAWVYGDETPAVQVKAAAMKSTMV